MESVLLLNQSYQPLSVISWKKAFSLITKEKAEVIESYDNKFLNTWSESFNAPCVIRLFYLVKSKGLHKPFNRRNIAERDKYICQYCGKKLTSHNFTFDHVHPKSLGGRSEWTNIVTACSPCNRDKANRTLNQSGMTLLNEPIVPYVSNIFIDNVTDKIKRLKHFPHESWRTYVYWNVELED